MRERRRARAASAAHQAVVETLPLRDRGCPVRRKLRQRQQAHARILAAFGVVGCGRGEAVWPIAGALSHAVVELCGRQRASVGGGAGPEPHAGPRSAVLWWSGGGDAAPASGRPPTSLKARTA